MIKRSLPPTPTHILSFDYSIQSTPSPTSPRSCFPITSSSCSSPHFNQQQLTRSPPPRKRQRSTFLRMNNIASALDQSKEDKDLPMSDTTTTSSTSHSSTSQNWTNDSSISERDIAGPSRLGFSSSQQLDYNEDKSTFRLGNAPSSLALRIKKKPAKLALKSPNAKSEHLQVKESSGFSRSVPSSPVVYAKQGPESISVDNQLRDSLRGAPRRRPSVPFGLRIENNKLPSLSIPAKSAAVEKEGPPAIWQDPSEHILSGNGSSLQHARSVYASGPIEVLPGLFLGDEFNACDDASLARLGIRTIINVAKETVLPFQQDEGSEKLDLTPSIQLHQRIQNFSLADPTSSSPSATMSAYRPMTAARETFFTPKTSLFPPSGYLSPQQPQSTLSPSFYTRDVSSTPNLLASFDVASSRRSSSPDSSIDSDPSSPDLQQGNTPQILHHYALSTTTPSSNGAETIATSATSYNPTPLLVLPENAIALNVAPSPQTGRSFGLKYIKLPWTHDETDLAGSSAGGFMTGCTLIANALGIDLKTGAFTRSDSEQREGVLVHCQCGVSRSATLVIAFVMQAAAYNLDFEKTQNLTGMHDCYEMVKELSSSISPNCSLIYQLVEWERQLSKQVAERTHMDIGRVAADPSALSGDKKWGNEAMNEEDWTRMRREEEMKEREEEDQMRDERLAAAQLISKQRLTSSSPPLSLESIPLSSSSLSGIGARRRRMTPSLKLFSSAKTAADEIVNEERQSSAQMDGDSAVMNIPPELAEMESGRQYLTPLAGAPSALPKLHRVSPLGMTTPSTGSGTSTLHAVNSPHLNATFGVNASISAAERRNKHKRTFSKEIPGWNRRSITTLSVPGAFPSP